MVRDLSCHVCASNTNHRIEGFIGAQKLFLFEFSMPLDGVTSGANADMPAIWMLNSQIPRTLQYGSADCSCWESGCGEFDIFEVLTTASTRAKSTLHGNISGGDSDYFVRPTNDTIKVAVTMGAETATIKILDADFDFSSDIAYSTIETLSKLADSLDTSDLDTSLFALSS